MKDALSIYCDESQKDWDLHLNGVTAAYNTTVNSQTGFTPFFMLYGREARLPSEKWLRSFGQTTGVLPYVTKVVNALTNVWDAAAANKPAELQRMREGQKPIRHLQFAEYQVGEYAMIANTPKSQNIGWVDAKFRKLNLKLQPRYSGPYLIIRRISPVVYVLQVDGFDVNVHATNLKPFVGRKTAMTPYAEPGFDSYQIPGKAASEPLLLSPDSNLNENARVRFKRKNISRQKGHSEEVNARQSREQRAIELRERLSATQESLVVDEDLSLEREDAYTSLSLRIPSAHDGDKEDSEEETNMTEILEHDEPTTPEWEAEFKQRTLKGFNIWDGKTNSKKIYSTDYKTPSKLIYPIKRSTTTTDVIAKEMYQRSKEILTDHTKELSLDSSSVRHPRKRFKRSLRQQTTRTKPNYKGHQQVEECNLAGGEKWEQSIGNASVDLREQRDPHDSDTAEGSISSEDSFDREQWHRSVLKACTNHASKLNLSAYEPIIFGFDEKVTHKLRVELDMMIEIPIEYRRLWYRLHLEIRHFGKTGLLFPINNPILECTDHWRNNSTKHQRHTPLNIYIRLLSIPTSLMKTLFHPQCQGKITLSTDPNNTESIKDDASEIQQKYDQWYWDAMRTARRMDIHPSSPRRAYSKLRGHSRKEGLAMNGPEWRAHHYYMWDAIKRNQILREPPSWFMKEPVRC
jgi:hypothetical protein